MSRLRQVIYLSQTWRIRQTVHYPGISPSSGDVAPAPGRPMWGTEPRQFGQQQKRLGARWRAVGPWPAHAPGRPKWNAIFNLALVATHPALRVIIVPGAGWDPRPRPPLRLAGAPEGRTWLSVPDRACAERLGPSQTLPGMPRADQPPCRAFLSSFSCSSLREDLSTVPP